MEGRLSALPFTSNSLSKAIGLSSKTIELGAANASARIGLPKYVVPIENVCTISGKPYPILVIKESMSSIER